MKIETILKQTRQNAGLTQVQISKKTGIPIRSYQNYESSKRIPDVYTAQRIANALNIDNVNKIFPLPEEIENKNL